MKRPSSEDMLIISSDIWKSALDDLSEKDKQCLLEATAGQETCSATIHDLLELTNTKKAECVEKRWKVRVGDRTIILRDVLEKMSVWVAKIIIQSSGDNAANLAIFTFQWLLYAHKTIDLDSFASIASSYFSGGSSNQNYEGLEVIDVCANLVIQRPGTYTFEFAHLSVREFFEGLDQKGIKDFISKTGHESIAVACIRHLLHAATRGMAGLELDSNCDEDIAQVINDDLVKVSDDTDDDGETFPESILGLYDALEGVEIGISEGPGKQDSLKTKQERIASEISKTTESRYSTDEWVFHVQGAGELRKSDPLKTLINAFVFEEDCPGKVSLMFEGCCLAASLTHDSPRLGAE
ncbi:hypothetical protein CSUB01_01350 [Colletotrichum sublineola]|uniref:Uncharacterized protein n=1 Tax=Colletotrichum sublineola TaxID=1173701 RepID=A0A066X5Q5_COLSU|nr:hypothetical protein CSUB01_01350 [Colletotrichum sublineola]